MLFMISIAVVFLWSFAIERNKKKAIFMILINLLFINSTQFLLYYVKIDPYSQPTTFINNDPIYEDYKNVIRYIYSKEKFPATYVYEIGKPLDSITPIKERKLRVSIGTINGIDNKTSAKYDTSEKYKQDISLNIKNLEAIDSIIVFRRNKKVLAKWHYHFQNIDNIIKEHSSEKYFKENFDSFRHILPGVYLREEVYSNLIVELINLEDYHNRILKNHSNCKNIAELAPLIINIPANLVDNIFTDYENKEQPLRYKFDELEDDDYRKYNTRK